ncbi:MAG: NYN domain-containing protein [Pseudomonadota bacterium]
MVSTQGAGPRLAAPAFCASHPMRTYIYIDGFNFYYRAVRNTPFKWLDLKEFFTKLLSPANQILSIKYFTARVTGKFDPDQPIRQKTYLRALQKHIPEISIYYGHFLSNKVYAPLATPIGSQRSFGSHAIGKGTEQKDNWTDNAWEGPSFQGTNAPCAFYQACPHRAPRGITTSKPYPRNDNLQTRLLVTISNND